MYKLAIFSWQDKLDYFNDCIKTERRLKVMVKRIIAKKNNSLETKQTAKGVLSDIIRREHELIEQRDQAEAALSAERDMRLTTITTVTSQAIGDSASL